MVEDPWPDTFVPRRVPRGEELAGEKEKSERAKKDRDNDGKRASKSKEKSGCDGIELRDTKA